MKTTPFVKVNTQDTVGIENAIPKILKPQNQQQKPVVGCAAYLAAKDYFDNLRNRIKAYDPESVVDYYIIDISDHPSRPGSSTDFSVTITTKDGHDKVGSFNVERNDPNQPVDWNNVMDTLANNITSIIKYYKSAPLINEDIETLKQKISTTQSKTKKLEDKNQEILSSKMDNVKDNVIETTTDDNVVYYPVLAENTTETSETSELDKAKKEVKEHSIFDIISEEDLKLIESCYYYNVTLAYSIQSKTQYYLGKNIYKDDSFNEEFYNKIICEKKYDRKYFSDNFINLMELAKKVDFIKDPIIEITGIAKDSYEKVNNDLIKLIQNF